MSPFLLFHSCFEDECLFPCGFDLRYVLLKDLLYSLFPFCSCFVPDALLDPLGHLLQLLLVFSRDGPSLMSLVISSSLLSVFLLRLPVAPSFVHPSA